jgi:hypothetical protein
MKDVVSCEKLRGAANKRRSEDLRMGKPGTVNPYHSVDEHIVFGKLTGRTETSQYPQEQKEISISSVAASERETA